MAIQLCLFLSHEIQGQKQLQYFLLKLFFLIDTALSTNINSFIQQIVLRNTVLTWTQIIFSFDVHFNYGDTWILFWLQSDQTFSFFEPLNILPNTKIPKFQVSVESRTVSLFNNPKPNTLNPNRIHLESFWNANSLVSLGKVPISHAEFSLWVVVPWGTTPRLERVWHHCARMKCCVVARSRKLYTQHPRPSPQDGLHAELTYGERQAERPEQRPGVGHRQGQLDSLWSALPGLTVGARGDEEG